MGEEKQYQIPFRYGEIEAEKIKRICELQYWKKKKNQAIKDALYYLCELMVLSKRKYPEESVQGRQNTYLRQSVQCTILAII